MYCIYTLKSNQLERLWNQILFMPSVDLIDFVIHFIELPCTYQDDKCRIVQCNFFLHSLLFFSQLKITFKLAIFGCSFLNLQRAQFRRRSCSCSCCNCCFCVYVTFECSRAVELVHIQLWTFNAYVVRCRHYTYTAWYLSKRLVLECRTKAKERIIYNWTMYLQKWARTSIEQSYRFWKMNWAYALVKHRYWDSERFR